MPQPAAPDSAVTFALDRAHALVAADLDRVNATIIQRMDSPVALIPQLASHIVAAGGKRVRPMLTLLGAQICGYAGARHIDLAACVEFIHTATLLHDDVVDDSAVRRGQDSANAIWGPKPSVLVGDFLFSRAFQLMVNDGSLRVLKILSDASATIAEGEVLQLTTANDVETDRATHLRVIEAKTARLFAAAAQIGAVVGERPEDEEAALEAYGLNLGMAFQIADDVMDYAADGQLGKAPGDDFRDGKITMPVVMALERAEGDERAFWARTLEDQEIGADDFDRALEILTARAALKDALAGAHAYAQTAKDALDVFAESETRDAMRGLVDYAIARAA